MVIHLVFDIVVHGIILQFERVAHSLSAGESWPWYVFTIQLMTMARSLDV